ncbi:uncharacterized protein LOC134442667 [Engraulis encrasicolus]|uniref:uncharacterized protein LOC134442667 n=1 Tax=Engraulis encrasicolus TaxID=184585 RepID=UPI002FD29E48
MRRIFLQEDRGPHHHLQLLLRGPMLRMKTAGVVLLLLWSGQCVTAASSEALQTTGTGKDYPPQPDIQTVLREMSSLIAEQRVELKCTKTQLETVEKKAEAMEERLRASESKAEAMEGKLRASENLVNQLKIENKAQAMGLNLTVTDVSNQKKEREQSRVSFSASLVKEGDGRNIGPTAVDAPLVFRNDFTNIGNAYSANTGTPRMRFCYARVFTAPTRGVYFSVVFVLGQGHGSTATGVWLFKNDKRFALAWSRQQDGFTKPSNGASVVMEKGDEVYVKLNSGAWVHDNENNNCVFSGHLLFPM